MYLPDNHSTELVRERQELLAREARDARLVREQRAARREQRSTSGPRTARSAG